MKDTGLDHRHRDKDGAISKKHGNTLVGTLRKIYGKGFAAGYPDTTELSEVLHQLNETSLSQLRRDHDTGHLSHKIDHVPDGRHESQLQVVESTGLPGVSANLPFEPSPPER